MRECEKMLERAVISSFLRSSRKLLDFTVLLNDS